jgi:hypothetical protein
MGLHVRLDRGRYRVGFAVLDDGDGISYQYSLHAPTEDEAEQLAELRRTATRVLEQQRTDLVVVGPNESSRPTQLRTCGHAEGVLLAACGELGLKVET